MKTNILLLAAILAVTTAFVSCSKSKNETLSTEQQVLLGNMNSSYKTAKVYNDSLINLNVLSSSDTILTYRYDSCYHANDSIFDHCHTTMMNSNEGMMGGNSGMMGDNGSNGMCDTQYDELNEVMIQMSQLREIHTDYHPD
jgi:hypothetical protein